MVYSSIQRVCYHIFLSVLGFGPVAGVQWEEFDGKLYQPYNAREKIGKVCDFVSAAMIAAANVQVVHIRPVAQTGPGEKKQVVAAATEIFDEEDKGFEVVEENTVLKKK